MTDVTYRTPRVTDVIQRTLLHDTLTNMTRLVICDWNHVTDMTAVIFVT
jgi:hypothetical protein